MSNLRTWKTAPVLLRPTKTPRMARRPSKALPALLALLSVLQASCDDSNANSGASSALSVNKAVADLEVIYTTSGDNFNVDSLSLWSLRHLTEATTAQYVLLDINQTTPSALTIVPTRTPGWFADSDAPLIYRLIEGNFAVETNVTVTSNTNPTVPPSANFNSAGLMARNPSGRLGSENYIMVNLGRQDNSISLGIGTEHKSTTNSVSTLELQAGTNSGRLILCRTADQFSTYRFLDNETGWSMIKSERRTDLPSQLQVGMIANAFTGPDNRSVFKDISLRKPLNIAQCLP